MSSAGKESPSISRGRPQKPCAPCGSRLLPEKAGHPEGAWERFQTMLYPETWTRRGDACGLRLKRGAQAEWCLLCRRGRDGKRGARQSHNGPSAEGGKAKMRQRDERHGADRRRRRPEGAEAKKSRVAERGRSVRRGDAAGKISRSAGEASCFLAEGARFVR